MAAVLGLLAGAYVAGYLSHKHRLPPYGVATRLREVWAPEAEAPADLGPGRFAPVRDRSSGVASEVRFHLAALGYLEGYEAGTGDSGVTRYDSRAAQSGLNLYNSGHGPEAFLVDMHGRVLHRWRKSFEEAFPGVDAGNDRSQGWWRRVHLLPDGGLLAIFEGHGLIRIDRRSELAWALPGMYHHEVWIAEDGTFWVLYRERRSIPELGPEEVLEDFAVQLTPEGEELRRISLLRALEHSPFGAQLENVKENPLPPGDLLHANSIEILDDSRPHPELFGAGQALVSFRNLHAVAVLDLETERITWLMTGLWSYQHEPSLLPSGHLLVFDNLGDSGRSRVVEVDPVTQRVAWAYRGTEANGFFSATLGACQRLPNGNTLITESEAGRAFEVTPEGRIVWEFYNPARAGEHAELVATLFEVLRLPEDFAPDWLHEAAL